MKARIALLILCVFVTALILPLVVSAEAPYKGYNYNYWGQSAPAPNGYLPDRVITGRDLGIGELKNPQDMHVDKNKDLFILDSGNSRIVVLDSSFRLKKVIDKFQSDEEEIVFNDPKGIFVDDEGLIYIADRGNGRIVVVDMDGNLVNIIGRPVSDILGRTFNYLPEKVVVDRTKTMYVMAYGVYQGLISFDEAGNFNGFFGSNRVQMSLSLAVDRLWKRLLSRKQREAMVRYVPVEYSNVYLCDNDFVYTSTRNASVLELKKLNPLGNNILIPRSSSPHAGNFGDLESVWFKASLSDTAFIDINVTSDGIISGLDLERGRIFQYDQECNPLFIFGGIGSQKGTFSIPVAIESIGDTIIVLDSNKNSITTFYLTEFGIWVKKAVQLYNDGLYEEAIEPWQQVLRRNSNYELAYIGIGKALMKLEDYQGAMENFKLGNDKRGYALAYSEYRTKYLRDNFTLVTIIVMFIIFLLWALTKYKKISVYVARSIYKSNNKVVN